MSDPNFTPTQYVQQLLKNIHQNHKIRHSIEGKVRGPKTLLL